jgi:hypothetical protein
VSKPLFPRVSITNDGLTVVVTTAPHEDFRVNVRHDRTIEVTGTERLVVFPERGKAVKIGQIRLPKGK